MTQKIINNTLADDRVKENYIFISDIHGNHETLGLIEQAKKDFPYAQLVTGGDYIDGRDSVKEVLDYLIEQKSDRIFQIMVKYIYFNIPFLLAYYFFNTEILSIFPEGTNSIVVIIVAEAGFLLYDFLLTIFSTFYNKYVKGFFRNA